MTQYPKAALFDLDGVLVDTENGYTQLWDDINRAFPTGIPNFALHIKGNTLERILSTYYPDAETQKAVVAMLNKYEEEMQFRLFDGVIEFLEALQKAGIPAAIVTSSNPAKMARLFGQCAGFRDYFDAVLTDADVSRGKPDPECYLKAAERLGADAADCVVFEDSFSGLKAGRAAGARVVALATTNPRESLVPYADRVIDSFRELNTFFL